MSLDIELQEVDRLRSCLTDPRERVAADARNALERFQASSHVSVRYAAVFTLGDYDGKLPVLVEQELLPQLVQRVREAREEKRDLREVVADAGQLFRATRSLRVWGVLAAMAGTFDGDIRKEAEKYGLDGYTKTF